MWGTGVGDEEKKIEGKELALKSTKGADTPRFIRSQAPEFGIRIVYMTASLVCETKKKATTSPVRGSRVHSTKELDKRRSSARQKYP